MKRKLRIIISLVLVLCVAASLFACDVKDGDTNGNGNTTNNNGNNNNGGGNNGNGGNKGDEINNAAKAKPTNVYREAPFNLGINTDSLWSAVMVGGRLYYSTTAYNEETSGSIFTVESISLTDSNDKKSHVKIETYYKSEENIYQSMYVNNFAVANDGTIWVTVIEYYEDYTDPNFPIYENSSKIRHYGADGVQTHELSSKELLPDAEYAYFGNMKFQGNFMYLTVETQILAINSSTGLLEFTISDNGTYFDQMFQINDGRVGVQIYDYESDGRFLKLIDPATKGWGETIKLETNTYFDYVMPGDNEYLLYYAAYNQGIMGLKKDGTAVEIMNYINSDIDSSNISNIMKLENGDFLMLSYNYEATENQMVAARLTKVPDDEVREAVMLTYACMYMDYNIRRKALEFNKTNGIYRINIVDYSQYSTNGNWNAGYDRLNADIIGGKIPDMMSLEGLDFRNYANKGILADLYELMDASETVNREDYLQNVLSAAEYNGKLYRFMPNFSISTTVGKKSVFSGIESWTFDDVDTLLRSRPGAKLFGNIARQDLLYYFLSMTVNSYIDWDTGLCSFDEDFVKLIELVKTYPETIDWDAIYDDPNFYEQMELDYAEERVLLRDMYVSSYRDVRDQASYQFRGEDITFPGYPTGDGNGSVFNAYAQHGVSAVSPFKQVCFDFLASTVEMVPNFENSGGYFYGQFSISKAYMDAVREYEMTPMRQRPGYDIGEYDEIGITARDKYASGAALSSRRAPLPMPDPGYEEDEYTKNYHLRPEEVAEVDKLLENTKTFTTYNEAVMNIITEEVNEFFAGRRSASDTARIIQSRVQIMVSESM